MKKVLLSILLILLPMLASADAVEIDGIWYNLVPKVKKAEVTSNPNGSKYLGSIEIPASFTYNDIKYSVTSIGKSAFYECFGLSSVTISNSVTSIGELAFRGCSSLTSVTIPNSVTSIGERAFLYCSSLTSVTIPNSVISIGNDAFQDCSSLTSVIIPNSVTSIGERVFSGCSGLTSVTIPNSVTSIGWYAFQNCSGLTSITIPNSVTSIGKRAFYDCCSLTSVTIPNSVTRIGDYTFADCNGLISITIGCGVTSIGEQAFANCDELMDVYCLAENLENESWYGEGLYTYPDAFKESYPQAMTLHVPAASIEAYRSTEPWSQFKAFVALEDGDIPATQKCATPTISFNNGKVSFTCETEGAEFVSEVKASDAKLYYDSEYTLSQKYTISVYATKTGYDNSDTVTRDIIITGDGKTIIVGDVDGDGKVNVADHVKLSEIIMN